MLEHEIEPFFSKFVIDLSLVIDQTITPDQVFYLFMFLEQHSEITCLKFIRYFNPELASAIAKQIKTNDTLTAISFEDITLDIKYTESFRKIFTNHETLEEIHFLKNTELCDNFISDFFNKTLPNTNITTLHFSRILTSPETTNHIAHLLQTNTTIQFLKLVGIFSTNHLPLVLSALQSKSLIDLYLKEIKFSDEDYIEIAKSLSANQMLKFLKMVNCSINDNHVFHIAEALNANRTLEILQLNQNFIQDTGASYIAEALKTNMNLEKLSLKMNPITNIGATALLSSTGGLKVLEIQSEHISIVQEIPSNRRTFNIFSKYGKILPLQPENQRGQTCGLTAIHACAQYHHPDKKLIPVKKSDFDPPAITSLVKISKSKDFSKIGEFYSISNLGSLVEMLQCNPIVINFNNQSYADFAAQIEISIDNGNPIILPVDKKPKEHPDDKKYHWITICGYAVIDQKWYFAVAEYGKLLQMQSEHLFNIFYTVGEEKAEHVFYKKIGPKGSKHKWKKKMPDKQNEREYTSVIIPGCSLFDFRRKMLIIAPKNDTADVKINPMP